MNYNIKSIYTDPEQKHWIEERWEASSDSEFIEVLKDVLDVPLQSILDGGFDAYAEKLHAIGFEDEEIKSEWDTMVAAAKHYQEALDAIRLAEAEDGSTHWKEGTPYVIDVDDNFKIYITVS